MAERVTDTEADAYWATRDRASRLGAWASQQSRPLPNRQVLEDKIAQYDARFANRDVPRPAHWSGFRVVPDRLEFWKAAASRLNERRLYQQQQGKWTATLLYP